jgi:hypothetical protein
MPRPPRYVQRFLEALLEVAPSHLELPICRPPIRGSRGILTTSAIMYNEHPFNLLRRHHEYTFQVGDTRLELSMQLYLNETDHWRLFCYSRAGMLLSINLSLLRETGDSLALTQKLSITARHSSPRSREQRTAQLCATLTKLGLQVDQQRQLILGTFDTRAGQFLDTTPQAFVRDFALASLIKGHFMGNKGYRLPGLPAVPFTWTAVQRSTTIARVVPLGLRYRVLEQAHGRCVACGNGVRDGARLHVDHIVPYSQGGRTEESNLQALCDKCNLGKGGRSSRRFRPA